TRDAPRALRRESEPRARRGARAGGHPAVLRGVRRACRDDSRRSRPAAAGAQSRVPAGARVGRLMTLAIDVFWSFRSPYSYLATPRLARLARDYDLDVNLRVVLPIAVRIPGFFDTVNPLWPPYLMRDTWRIAEYEGIPYGWPRPDPIVQDFATGEIAREQPYIHRLTRLGVAAAER